MQSDSDLAFYATVTNATVQPTHLVSSKNNNKNSNNCCKYYCFSLCFITHFVCPCCKFYSAKTYVFILSLMTLSYTMISSGYISAIMTSLQRQFNMPTSKIGLILSSFDIISIFAVPIISYLGAKTNRPRLMAIFSLIYVFGCVIFTLPYFLGPKYIINSSNIKVNYTDEQSVMYQDYDLCVKTFNTNSSIITTRYNNDTIACLNSNDNTWTYYIFIIGQLAMSLGVSPLFSLGLTYLCDNIEERSQALYTGNTS